MGSTERLLEFVVKLGAEPRASLAILQRAVAASAPYYHIAHLDVDIDESQGFLPSTMTRLITLYLNPEAPDEDGEAIEQNYEIAREGRVRVLIYPGDTPWTEDEKKELVIFSHITFFYYGRIRFSEVVEKSAMTQYLSGLPNAGGYFAKAMPLLRQCKLTEYDSYSFNLRGFGLIGKRYGVEQGDLAIRKYAEALKLFARDDEIIGHLGGDNFVALIRKENSPAFLEMLSCIPIVVEGPNGPVPVQISAVAGGWHIEENVSDVGDIIGLPSIALHMAKNVLHTPVVYVTQEILNRVSEEKRVLQVFPEALEDQEFTVYYQPKVDSRTNRLEGAEGLVRWIRKERFISPGAFLPVLEREGEIVKLDLYVLEKTCQDLRKWIDEGIEPVQISVNFSRKDLSTPHLAEKIAEIIERYGIDRSLIQIEVTETTNETEHGKMAEFLKALWEMRISTAIDDFGSGYSSLSTLRNFQISMLKIDRSFINNEEFSENDEIILTDIVHMARRLGIDVITEGVERPDQLEFVNKVGCDLIQGYLYDKPMDGESFRERLLNKEYQLPKK